MAMKPEEILQRLVEIEDHMEAAKRLESPPTGWHDTAWLCQVVRELLARSERLEAVAEAARAYVALGRQFETVDPIKESAKRFQALEEAIAVLEEGK